MIMKVVLDGDTLYFNCQSRMAMVEWADIINTTDKLIVFLIDI